MNDNGILKEKKLQELSDEIGDCKRCKLHTTRTSIVLGEGNPGARVMFIGEGPGRDEDIQGRPFVGRAGQLLTAIIEKGMMLNRADVYIANVVKCRPTVDLKFERDRPPDEEERSMCGPFLLKQIEIIRPEIIVTLGNPSTQFLLGTKQGITKLRGTWQNFRGIPVMPTYHPSFVLRNGGEASPLKREVWEDIKKIIQKLNNPDEESQTNAAQETTNEFLSLRTPLKDDKDKQGTLF